METTCIVSVNDIDTLKRFRHAAYDSLNQVADAQFELVDAVLLETGASSFVELSLSPAYRQAGAFFKGTLAVLSETTKGRALVSFVKQSLLWTAPRFKESEEGQRWSDLVVLATWQLWLARAIVQDQPRSWEKTPRTLARLSPGRVWRAFGGVLARIGRPTCVPKLPLCRQARRGKSPARAPGQRLRPRKRYKVVRKTTCPPRGGAATAKTA